MFKRREHNMLPSFFMDISGTNVQKNIFAYNIREIVGGIKMSKRGKVWLGVAGLVINDEGEWLVVKKSYSGLKGKWSLPAGFVDEGETIDEAVIREIKEETGIDCQVKGLIGFRTGIIRDEISDNMAIFLATPRINQPFVKSERELLACEWRTPKSLVTDHLTSAMLKEMASSTPHETQFCVNETVDPGDIFGYTSYKLFF